MNVALGSNAAANDRSPGSYVHFTESSLFQAIPLYYQTGLPGPITSIVLLNTWKWVKKILSRQGNTGQIEKPQERVGINVQQIRHDVPLC